MTLIILAAPEQGRRWREALHAQDPGLPIVIEGEDRNWKPEEIEAVILGMRAFERLDRFPNLRAIFSLWAGVDHLLTNPYIPAHIPLTRMVDPSLTIGMVTYILSFILHFRQLTENRVVTILGAGELGRAVARAATELQIDICLWRQSDEAVPGFKTYHGKLQLPAALKKAEILVCLLPLTPTTENILSGSLFALLPEGACLINAGRGRQLDEADLLSALRSGRIAYAALDVFREEPLPAHHPFWEERRLFLTPHLAAQTKLGAGAADIAANYRRLRSGKSLLHLVDRSRAY